MEIKFNKNNIEKLFYKKKNIINPFDIEFADSYSFFTFHKNRTNCEYKIINYKTKKIFLETVNKIKMKEGKGILKNKSFLKQNVLIRESEYNLLESSALLDFVQRYRFKKELFGYGIINDKKIKHKNKNKYYLFETDEVRLFSKDFYIKISFLGSEFPLNKFKRYMYIRDDPKEWVIHIRLLPFEYNKDVLKLCVPYGGTMNQIITNYLLKFFPFLREFLKYRGERKPWKFPFNGLSPNIFPVVYLNKLERIKIKSSLEIIKK